MINVKLADSFRVFYFTSSCFPHQNFYKESRRDMYIRYISRLYELHYSASNFVEAGLTLRLYAQLLSWSQAIQPAEMSYARQTEAERKEELFVRIMDCFDKGKVCAAATVSVSTLYFYKSVLFCPVFFMYVYQRL